MTEHRDSSVVVVSNAKNMAWRHKGARKKKSSTAETFHLYEYDNINNGLVVPDILLLILASHVLIEQWLQFLLKRRSLP